MKCVVLIDVAGHKPNAMGNFKISSLQSAFILSSTGTLLPVGFRKLLCHLV